MSLYVPSGKGKHSHKSSVTKLPELHSPGRELLNHSLSRICKRKPLFYRDVERRSECIFATASDPGQYCGRSPPLNDTSMSPNKRTSTKEYGRFREQTSESDFRYGPGQPGTLRSWIAGSDGLLKLLAAAEIGNKAVIQQCAFYGGVDVNQQGPKGRTPLCAAAEGGHSTCVTLLRNMGARIFVEGGALGRSALHWAADAGHLLAAQALFDTNSGTDNDSDWEDTDSEVNRGDSEGNTPLFLASRSPSQDRTVFLYLLRRGGAYVCNGPPHASSSPPAAQLLSQRRPPLPKGRDIPALSARIHPNFNQTRSKSMPQRSRSGRERDAAAGASTSRSKARRGGPSQSPSSNVTQIPLEAQLSLPKLSKTSASPSSSTTSSEPGFFFDDSAARSLSTGSRPRAAEANYRISADNARSPTCKSTVPSDSGEPLSLAYGRSHSTGCSPHRRAPPASSSHGPSTRHSSPTCGRWNGNAITENSPCSSCNPSSITASPCSVLGPITHLVPLNTPPPDLMLPKYKHRKTPAQIRAEAAQELLVSLSANPQTTPVKIRISSPVLGLVRSGPDPSTEAHLCDPPADARSLSNTFHSPLRTTVDSTHPGSGHPSPPRSPSQFQDSAGTMPMSVIAATSLRDYPPAASSSAKSVRGSSSSSQREATAGVIVRQAADAAVSAPEPGAKQWWTQAPRGPIDACRQRKEREAQHRRSRSPAQIRPRPATKPGSAAQQEKDEQQQHNGHPMIAQVLELVTSSSGELAPSQRRVSRHVLAHEGALCREVSAAEVGTQTVQQRPGESGASHVGGLERGPRASTDVHNAEVAREAVRAAAQLAAVGAENPEMARVVEIAEGDRRQVMKWVADGERRLKDCQQGSSRSDVVGSTMSSRTRSAFLQESTVNGNTIILLKELQTWETDLLTETSQTLLMLAAAHGRLGCARLLLERGARPWVEGALFNRSAFHWAAESGSYEILSAMVNKLPPQDTLTELRRADSKGMTPVALAAQKSGDRRAFLSLLRIEATLGVQCPVPQPVQP